jgi:hypothetical protein
MRQYLYFCTSKACKLRTFDKAPPGSEAVFVASISVVYEALSY